MSKSEETKKVIRDEYERFDVPADEVARTPELAERLMNIINAKVEVSEQFISAAEFSTYLVNLRRRGSAKGGLPKLRDGHGPGLGSRSSS